MEKTMKDLRVGEKARVKRFERFELTGAGGRRFRDIGLIEGAPVERVMTSPFGDPSAYLVRGAVMAIRGEDGERIIVSGE